MKKVHEYREHAARCRELARRGDENTRRHLLTMAKTWESLAVDREIQIARQERIRALEVRKSPADGEL
jgi:hypothetical protein